MSDIGTTASTGLDFSPAKIADLIKRSDLGLAIGIMAILVVLILPLPTWMLDISLAFSLSFSILILMTAVFIRKPLEFSSFPTILLITTMLRLALNLASTRLILGHGNEGTGPGVTREQAHVPAEQPPSRPDARFPAAHADQGRPRDPRRTPA